MKASNTVNGLVAKGRLSTRDNRGVSWRLTSKAYIERGVSWRLTSKAYIERVMNVYKCYHCKNEGHTRNYYP